MPFPYLTNCVKRVLKFVLSCYNSDSDLVRFVAKHGTDARMNSLLGRNVTFCCLCYGISVNKLCILPLKHSFLENVLVCV